MPTLTWTVRLAAPLELGAEDWARGLIALLAARQEVFQRKAAASPRKRRTRAVQIVLLVSAGVGVDSAWRGARVRGVVAATATTRSRGAVFLTWGHNLTWGGGVPYVVGGRCSSGVPDFSLPII